MLKFAQIRKLSTREAYDKYLFDFGFDKNGKRYFDAGDTIIEASVDMELKLRLVDTSTGKVFKSIYGYGEDSDKHRKAVNDIDDLSNVLKEAVKVKQKLLWEDYLRGAQIPCAVWKERYLENMFLNRVARIIVWEQDGITFIVTDDGIITSDGNKYLFKDKPVKIAHTTEMTEKDIKDWQKYFTANNMKQPFEQIWEPVIDKKLIHKDRYDNCPIEVKKLRYQEEKGIYIRWYDKEYYSEHTLKIFDFELEAKRYGDGEDYLEIKTLTPLRWSRRTNMIIAFLDKLTVQSRLIKDDVSVERFLPTFSYAQIMEFIRLATENNCQNVTALLLDYKQKNFADFDPMEEFSLDF